MGQGAGAGAVPCAPHPAGLSVTCERKAAALAAGVWGLPKEPTQSGCPRHQSPAAGGPGTTPSLGAVPCSWHRVSAAAGTGEHGMEREQPGEPSANPRCSRCSESLRETCKLEAMFCHLPNI